MSLLSCGNIKIAYDGNLAIDDISFEVEKGDYLYIVGENGSGKSTLIKVILGLLKPLSGQVIFNGVNKKDIGYLPQQTSVQKDFPASVFEVVLSGCLGSLKLIPFYSRREREIAEHNISLLGISKIKKKSYRDLSGGQQQRVLLARAFSVAGKFLVLDEPFSGLDPLVAHELHLLIKKLNSEAGVTVIMVSHDIGSALKYSNKVLHMDTKVAYFGATEKYYSTDICKRMMGGNLHA